MSTRRTLCESLRSSRFRASVSSCALRGLQRVADGAKLERLAAVIASGDHVHRNMPGARIALQLIEHAQPREVRQIDVEHDGARVKLLRGGQPVLRRVHHHALKAHLVRQVAQDLGEGHVVLDDQNEPFPRGEAVPVIGDGGRSERTRATRRRVRAPGGPTISRRCSGSDPAHPAARPRQRANTCAAA